MLWNIGNKLVAVLRSLFKTFYCAFRGIRYAINHERSMRIHICLLAFVIQFSLLYQLERSGYVVLLLLYGIIMSAEMLNTAVELLVDLGADGFHKIARVAKDVAAGAVLVVSLMSVVVWIILFSNVDKLYNVITVIQHDKLLIILLILQVGVGWLFVFCWDERHTLKLMSSKYNR